MKDILLIGAALYVFYQFRNGWPILATANAAPATVPVSNTTIPQTAPQTTPPVMIGADLTGAAVAVPQQAPSLANTGQVQPISLNAPLDIVGAANAYANYIDSLTVGNSNDPRYAPGVINVAPANAVTNADVQRIFDQIELGL